MVQRWIWVILLSVFVVLTGCSSAEDEELSDYVDRLEEELDGETEVDTYIDEFGQLIVDYEPEEAVEILDEKGFIELALGIEPEELTGEPITFRFQIPRPDVDSEDVLVVIEAEELYGEHGENFEGELVEQTDQGQKIVYELPLGDDR